VTLEQVVQKVEYPFWIVYLASGLAFGGGLLGITYGVLSTSWDPRREGTWFGWTVRGGAARPGGGGVRGRVLRPAGRVESACTPSVLVGQPSAPDGRLTCCRRVHPSRGAAGVPGQPVGAAGPQQAAVSGQQQQQQ
jgi:hypothetical protein